MKEETNNEMDLMLRRLEGTMDPSAVHPENGDGSTPEVHLDADEVNAYAENALPPTTRARYTEHLADCTRCRQIVSQLSQAAGLVFEEKTSAQPAVTGLREFISSLFSPMVLRYAVPALGVILVATLGLFMLRQQSAPQEVALKGAADNVTSRTEPAAPEQPSPSYHTYNRLEERPVQKEGVKAGEQQPEANKKLDAAEADTAKVEREEKRQEQVTTVDQIAEAQPAAPAKNEAPKAKEPSGDKKASADESADDARRGQAVAAAPQSVSAEQQKELALAKARDNEGGARAGVFGAASSKTKSEVSRARSQPSVGTAEVNASRRADKDEAQSRSVGGHRFERRGSLWVDVTYDSRATTNVVRGSEQYRALIADEPSIKTIADQLDGEIIVMWNNRAYRIR